MNVKTLTLVDECTAISSHVNNSLLTQLPNCLVHCLELLRNIGNILDRSVVCNNTILHIITPETHIDKIAQQPRINDLELSSKDTTRVDIGSVRFETFVETEDL